MKRVTFVLALAAVVGLAAIATSFASEGKKPNLIDCTVENITFLGSIVRIQIRIGNTLLNMDTFNNPFLELPKIGDPVEVTCSREAVLVIEHGVVSQ